MKVSARVNKSSSLCLTPWNIRDSRMFCHKWNEWPEDFFHRRKKFREENVNWKMFFWLKLWEKNMRHASWDCHSTTTTIVLSSSRYISDSFSLTSLLHQNIYQSLRAIERISEEQEKLDWNIWTASQCSSTLMLPTVLISIVIWTIGNWKLNGWGCLTITTMLIAFSNWISWLNLQFTFLTTHWCSRSDRKAV